MGKFAPVFLAFLLNSIGVNIFRENPPGCEPLISCLIFLLAVFILLWDMRLYPASLRKLARHGNFLLEFLLADFIMEHIMADFWFPLEASLSAILPKIAEFEKELLKQGGWDSGGIFSFLAWDGTIVVFSYLLSLFFLFAVFHATRIVDFRLLTCGFGVFFKDIIQRLKKLRKKFGKFWGRKKAVKFKYDSRSMSKSCKSLASSSLSTTFDDPCADSEDDCVADDDDCLTSYYLPRRS